MQHAIRMETIDASLLLAQRGSLRRVFDRSIDGLILRGLVPPEVTQEAARRLESVAPRAEPVVDGAAIRMIGRPLQWHDPASARFQRADGEVRAACAALFEPALDFISHVHHALAELMSAPLSVPRTEGGASFCPLTLRFMPPGACVGPHHERTQLSFPSYATLLDQLDTAAILSFYVPLVPAERGGELVVYGLEVDDDDAGALRDGVGQAATLFQRFPPHAIDLGVGDLIVFDSGRLAHQVTTVGGGRTRCTLGGLVARDHDHTRLLSWS